MPNRKNNEKHNKIHFHPTHSALTESLNIFKFLYEDVFEIRIAKYKYVLRS